MHAYKQIDQLILSQALSNRHLHVRTVQMIIQVGHLIELAAKLISQFVDMRHN